MIRSIHPFPARMAPELALEKLRELPKSGIVLDPMVGSGTVLRQATSIGHSAIGFDMDPLAVLMTRVWTTPVDDRLVLEILNKISSAGEVKSKGDSFLPWTDTETEKFIDFWFADTQKQELRAISYALNIMSDEIDCPDRKSALDVLKIALSRIIITKDKGASLARDVSHSRPHKVTEVNDFPVRAMFERSISAVRKRLKDSPPPSGAVVGLGDARNLSGVHSESVDAVLTSPPYLNAIDYMRGHRLSLVWLGHKLSDLRDIRADSIGSERSPKNANSSTELSAIRNSMGELDLLPRKFSHMIDRYVQDIWRMIIEIRRVLKPSGSATLVVGNSCLRGVFIRNSSAVSTAARLAGMTLVSEVERPLPSQSRYLPLTSAPLGKRMRTETILSFCLS